MVTDYERRDFWKSPIKKREKVKITDCGDTKSWYNDKVGQVFEVESISVRDYYVIENGFIRSVLIKDAKIID